MFGGRQKRVQRLREGAEPQLEPGETVQELVQVQTGQSAWANAGQVAAPMTQIELASQGVYWTSSPSARRAGPHILVATDRNVYAMRLSGGRLFDVGEVVLRMPLSETQVSRNKDVIGLAGIDFHVMVGFGAHADRFTDYVKEKGRGSPTSRGG